MDIEQIKREITEDFPIDIYSFNRRLGVSMAIDHLHSRGYLGGVPEWQPIAAAPKNEKIWLSDGDYVFRGFYIDQWNCDFEDGFWTDGNTSDESEGSYGINYTYIPLKPQPIYFMKITKPAAPKG